MRSNPFVFRPGGNAGSAHFSQFFLFKDANNDPDLQVCNSLNMSNLKSVCKTHTLLLSKVNKNMEPSICKIQIEAYNKCS